MFPHTVVFLVLADTLSLLRKRLAKGQKDFDMD